MRKTETPGQAQRHRSKNAKPVLAPVGQRGKRVDLEFAVRDELLRITGIKPAIELALNSVGVMQFADFEGFTPLTLAHALEQRAGIDVSARTIKRLNWIGVAKQLACADVQNGESESKSASQEGFMETTNKNIQNQAARMAQRSEPTVEGDPEPGHDQIAQAGSMQKEESGQIGPTKKNSQKRSKTKREKSKRVPAASSKPRRVGTESTRPDGSKKSQASPQKPSKTGSVHPDGLLQTTPQQPSVAAAPPKSGISLHIQNASFEQFRQPEFPDQPEPKRLRTRLEISLTGAKAAAIMGMKTPVSAQVYSENLATKETELLVAKTRRLTPGKFDYVIETDFKVPKIGRYRLQTVVVLLDSDPRVDLSTGLVLTVLG